MLNYITLFFIEPSPTAIVVAAWTTVLVLTSGWQLYNRESKRRLKEQLQQQQSSIDVAQTTVGLYKEQIEAANSTITKLEADKAAQSKRITTLEAKTDLDSLRAELAGQYITVVAELKKESSEIQLRITQIIQSTVKEIMLGFAEHSRKDDIIQGQILSTLHEVTDLYKTSNI